MLVMFDFVAAIRFSAIFMPKISQLHCRKPTYPHQQVALWFDFRSAGKFLPHASASRLVFAAGAARGAVWRLFTACVWWRRFEFGPVYVSPLLHQSESLHIRPRCDRVNR